MSASGFKSGMWKILSASVIFSILLVAARMGRSHSFLYGSLVWNLFLAWIPYGISVLVSRKQRWFAFPVVFYTVLLLWLLFFPNAPYIITDLFHLKQQPAVPLWYDLLLIFSFAWNGLILGILSLMKMERELQRRLGERAARIFVVIVIALGAYGVFLGRYLRWNSWDVFTNPFSLILEMARMIRHPLHFTGLWAMTLLLSTLTGLIYLTLRQMGEERSAGR
jgi:uncharacterized membrane protein